MLNLTSRFISFTSLPKFKPQIIIIKKILLARTRLHTNKQKLSSQKQRRSHLPIQPSPPPLPAPTKTASPVQLPKKTLKYLIFISRRARGLISKQKFSNNRKLGKPRQTFPCHPCQAHKEKKSYHPTWLGEFNPKHC